ncbi:hypothetical protein E2562_002173 [Oryza meyeriana var. granulata]|uniref:Response regulatory domain-containing protein n=1 Tax=Oryza meyeriana var. granulata TaxID=110450 RepID=A0A6G1EEC6_9ORYZ|nr:hypothetical protein E2562_002173 [Oryza meyeriana var. granulata]
MSAQDAVEKLRENPWSHDIVLTDVHMPAEIDGFDLLQYSATEMDLPVIVFSADDDKKTVLKCVKHGARGYLVKPLRKEQLKNIRQHVYRRTLRNGRRRAAAEAGGGGSSKGERKRFVWPKELHERFVSIVHQLGVDTTSVLARANIGREEMISDASLDVSDDRTTLIRDSYHDWAQN